MREKPRRRTRDSNIWIIPHRNVNCNFYPKGDRMGRKGKRKTVWDFHLNLDLLYLLLER